LDGIVSPKEFIDLNNVDDDGFEVIGPKKRKKIYTLCSSNGVLYLKKFKYQLQQTRRKINTFSYIRPNRYEELCQLNDGFDESYDSSMEAGLLDEDLYDCCQTFPVELVDDVDPMPNEDDQDVIVEVDDEKETESDLEDEDEENEDPCSILGTHLNRWHFTKSRNI
jgi:hypothetical protein